VPANGIAATPGLVEGAAPRALTRH